MNSKSKTNLRIRAHEFITKNGWLPLGILVLTLLHWSILIFKVPVFPHGWFWNFHYTAIGTVWVLPVMAILLAIGLWYTYSPSRRNTVLLAGMIGLGFCFQHSFALLEGRGLNGIRDRITYTGHAKFAEDAVNQAGIISTLTNYEQLVQEGKLNRFAQSKPPGQLLFYMLTERVANFIRPHESVEERLAWMRTFACFAWPIFGFLVLIPLYALVKDWSGTETALMACWLYLLIPAGILITLHADQVLYPLLLVLSLLLCHIANRTSRAAYAIGAGAFVYCAIFISFSLLCIIPLAAAVLIASPTHQTGKSHLRGSAVRCSWFLLGLVVADLAFRIVLDYNIHVRFVEAMKFHASWREWENTPRNIIHCGILNTLEFALLAGVPLCGFALYGMLHSTEKSLGGEWNELHSLALALACVFAALLLFGKTKGESARLWLFLTPCVCIMGAYAIASRYARAKHWLIPVVVILQFITIAITKVCQDFY